VWGWGGFTRGLCGIGGRFVVFCRMGLVSLVCFFWVFVGIGLVRGFWCKCFVWGVTCGGN